MALVLARDTIAPPPFRARNLVTALRTADLTPLLRGHGRCNGSAATPQLDLPFDAAALMDATASAKLAHLDIGSALLAHTQAMAVIVNGKVKALQYGLLSFVSQAAWLFCLTVC